MYNRIILLGNLTKDVEVRYSKIGMAISSTSIATNRKFKSQDGEQKNEVMFIDLTFFGRTGEVAKQYLKKGSQILVEGRLVFQQWTGQDGSKKSKHTITVDNLKMLGGRDDDSSRNQSSSDSTSYNSNNNSNMSNKNNNHSSINDDEIPF